MQTQIRLLIEEQSDQGLHCLLFHLHIFDEIPKGLAELKVDYSKVFGVQKFRNLTVFSQTAELDFTRTMYSLFIGTFLL